MAPGTELDRLERDADEAIAQDVRDGVALQKVVEPGVAATSGGLTVRRKPPAEPPKEERIEYESIRIGSSKVDVSETPNIKYKNLRWHLWLYQSDCGATLEDAFGKLITHCEEIAAGVAKLLNPDRETDLDKARRILKELVAQIDAGEFSDAYEQAVDFLGTHPAKE